MKPLVIICLLLTFSFFSYGFTTESVSDSTSVSNDKSEIIFIRKTGTDFWFVPFKIFINNELEGKINYRKYSRHHVTPGTHNLAVQFSGKIKKDKTRITNIEVLPGKKHFILIFQTTGLFTSQIDAVEIDEQSAMTYLKQLKRDKE